MTYLLLMERWHLTFDQLCNTPQWVVDDMILVMNAEHDVDAEEDPKRK